MNSTPIITVDGPSGAGKGTLAMRLAEKLGFHFLDSGALYRLVAVSAMKAGIDHNDQQLVTGLAENLDIRFEIVSGGVQAFLAGDNVSDVIRQVEVSMMASEVAAYPAVREVLLGRQRAFCQAPGLVADGRDMGTTVFPGAIAKIYLTASAEKRAERRYKQLIDKGESVSLCALLEDINQRDKRDIERADSPLLPAKEAFVLDSTSLDIGQVEQLALGYISKSLKGNALNIS